MPMLLKTLLDGGLIHGDCMTVTGKTMAENLTDVKFRENQDVIHPVTNCLSPTGGVVGLWGTLAPDGAIVKVAGMSSSRCLHAARRAVRRRGGRFAAVEKPRVTRTARCW